MRYLFDDDIMRLKKAMESNFYKKKPTVVMKRSKIMVLSGVARNSHDGYAQALVRLGILELFDKRGDKEIYTIHLDALRKYKPESIAPPHEIL